MAKSTGTESYLKFLQNHSFTCTESILLDPQGANTADAYYMLENALNNCQASLNLKLKVGAQVD